ncbi:hypothetical protein LJC14_07475, partial [Treponema sp. OttesenSCG-928-L16]|nr:hypothetical protein [Treponema sp. OttesenSCG-928-L16]
MAKKIVLCLSILICSILCVYGVDTDPLCISTVGPSYPIEYKGVYQIYVKGSDIALVKIPTERGQYAIYDVIKKADIRRDEYGFPIATFFGRDAHFLLGGNYVAFRFLDEEESGMVYLPETCRYLIEGGPHDIYPTARPGNIEGIHDIYPSGIEVNCPSFLVEGTRRYTASNLTKTFIGVPYDGGMLFNTMGLPWSEGEEGPGIGVTLSIHFMPGSQLADDEEAFEGLYDAITIMNGYVDFYRPDLFLKNNRVKTVHIKSTDDGPSFEFEYELNDAP